MVSAELPSLIADPPRTYRVALVGNPNTGKSTLFNALAGMNVRTGNFPGVTIEKKVGRCRFDSKSADLVDLPGTYSLAPRSPDELVAVEVLTGDVPGEPPVDVILCVVNASVLQRNLFLVSQLLELGRPVVIALNMIDTAQARGMAIDVPRLSENLGVPVVPTAANRRQGLDELAAAVAETLDRHDTEAGEGPQRYRPLPEPFYAACDQLRDELGRGATGGGREQVAATAQDRTVLSADDGKPAPDRYLVERMVLDRGGEAEQRAAERFGSGVRSRLEDVRGRLQAELGDLTDMECAARYRWSAEQLEGALTLRDGRRGATDWLDAILTHRVAGLILFAALMLFIFQCIYSFATWPMDWIEGGIAWIGDQVAGSMEPGVLRSLIVDGVIAGVGGVLVFVPQIALLFLFLAILEDCGYMSRAAFLVDRVMSLFGLSGKSFLPLMSSFACAVPGIMATRVIENRRDRFATIMVAPLMSCSARLPVYLLLIGAFIPATRVFGLVSLPALVLMAMYLVGVVVAIPVSWLLKKTILKGETAPFVLELPEYKVPSPAVVLSRVWGATREFVVRAGTLIFAASIVIWFAGYWPGDHGRQYALQRELETLEKDAPRADEISSALKRESSQLLEASLLGRMGHAIEPAVRPLGWDWKIGVGAIASFPAREVIIATLGTIYSLGGDVDEESDGLIGAIRSARWPDGTPVYNVPVALSVMVFFALCAQCVSTLLVIKRETQSWRWPILSFGYMTVLAYLGALLTYQLGSRLM